MDVVVVEASSGSGVLGKVIIRAEIPFRGVSFEDWERTGEVLARALLATYPEGVVYVRVSGPPGSGKLALADDVVESVRSRGVTARSVMSRRDEGLPPRVVGDDDHQARFTLEVVEQI